MLVPHIFFTVVNLQIDFQTISNDAQFLSAIAIILGAIFVVFEMRNDERLLEATKIQASAAADQARLSTEQLKQNNLLATMNLVLAVYDMANSLEVQRSWTIVLKTKIGSLQEFEGLSEEKQLAFYQMASLFESIGLMVEKGYAAPDLVDDMFATDMAWNALEPFVKGMREKYPGEEFYFWFERLHERLQNLHSKDAK
jgi:predicted histidine transporter YuiF (NhaC family)